MDRAKAQPNPPPSPTAGGSAVKTKGRGHRSSTTGEESAHRGGHYEEIDHEGGGGGGRGEPAKSIEGWVVVVTGVHEEAQEEEVVDRFAEFGDVKNIQMNLDRRTGFVKGYAFIEYGSKKEAETAIKVRTDARFIGPFMHSSIHSPIHVGDGRRKSLRQEGQRGLGLCQGRRRPGRRRRRRASIRGQKKRM